MTNETTPNPCCYENSRHNPLQFDHNQISTAQTVSNIEFAAVQISENQNSGKLVSAMSLRKVAQINVSPQFQIPHYPTGVQFSNRNRTEEPNDGNFPPPIQHSTIKVPTLFAVHRSHLISRLLRKLPNYQTAIHPPIAQHISQPNVSGNTKQIPNWSFPGNQHFQPLPEIQTKKTVWKQFQFANHK